MGLEWMLHRCRMVFLSGSHSFVAGEGWCWGTVWEAGDEDAGAGDFS